MRIGIYCKFAINTDSFIVSTSTAVDSLDIVDGLDDQVTI